MGSGLQVVQEVSTQPNRPLLVFAKLSASRGSAAQRHDWQVQMHLRHMGLGPSMALSGAACRDTAQVHVKNRCAWLNHSSEPAAFIRLVERFPCICLWFSGVRHSQHFMHVPTCLSQHVHSAGPAAGTSFSHTAASHAVQQRVHGLKTCKHSIACSGLHAHVA